MQIVLATHNKGKVREIQEILNIPNLEIKTLSDFPHVPKPIEDGTTFFENAFKKARFIAERTQLIALADDSGLEVDALNGEPGVKSAIYAGENATDSENIKKLLNQMKDVPKNRRQARFRCVMVLYAPNGNWISTEGTCFGEITTEPRGDKGFGYDPVFLVPEYNMTFAELEPEIKNRLSHRYLAISQLKDKIIRFVQSNTVSSKNKDLASFEKNECLKLAVDITKAYAQSGENKHGPLTDVLERVFEKLIDLKKRVQE